MTVASRRQLKIGLVAGETSGDYLGAGLITAIRERCPEAEFVGICGPRMQAAGGVSLFPMDKISVMGLEGLFQSIAEILAIRRKLVTYFTQHPPDVFVGIDVPDFNLGLEAKLRRLSIPTVHYVSPTVWAWRGYRIRKIRRAVGHMLTLFPFEAEYYRNNNVPVSFVGHPIADEIDPAADRGALRREFGLSGKCVVALLPGSRMSELRRLGSIFIEAARELHRHHPDLVFVAPMASADIKAYFERLLGRYGDVPPIRVVLGRSREAMAAADVAILASGTAALESALLGVPMVVAYKVSWLTGVFVRIFARVNHFSMPNNLLSDPIVPELMQSAATPENLARAAEKYLTDEELRRRVRVQLGTILASLRRDANRRAAERVCAIAQAETE